MQATYEISRERDENILLSRDTDHSCPCHFHRKVELMYVQEGEKTVFSCCKEIVLKPDQIFIADSYCLHSYQPDESGKQIIVVFPNIMLGHYYDALGGAVLKSNVITDCDVAKKLKPLFENLFERNRNRLLYQANVDMLLGSIVEYIGAEQENLPDRESFIERVLGYINDHYAEDISLNVLAEYFGYSKYYFSRLFNLTLGTNITDYISVIRLEKALDKIKKTHCTVSAAALDSGFSSIPTFYRALKRNYKYKKIKDLL